MNEYRDYEHLKDIFCPTVSSPIIQCFAQMTDSD